MLLSRGPRRRSEDGAAAVEFALVTPLLFLVMFGILQYGLYFFDTLGTRQGVREAARQGVVENFSATGCTGSNSEKLACATSGQISAVTAPNTWVRVVAPSGWAKGKPLLVCAQHKSNGGVGLLPMPDGGWIISSTQLSIESELQKTTWTTATKGFPTNSALPSGRDWSWCT